MARTQVVEDAFGVPQLWAPDVAELSRLQGVVTARDRAWQLAVERWRAEGRVAEHLGADWVEWDRLARRARLDDTARRSFERLDPETADWVAAYAQGVGEGLAEVADGTPELVAVGAVPEPWHPWTPLSVLLTQHVLFGSLPAKLWRDHVRRVAPHATQLLSAAPGAGDGPAGGSNAWAVAGARSATGYPVIAGDPHRVVGLPSVYHQVRLACPEFDVVGLAFAGVPGVPHFGHAGSVAWAITNAMADCHDVFEEDLRRDGDRVLARGPEGWVETDAWVETVAVRDADPVAVEAVETERGPVLVGGPEEDRALSVRMAPRVLADTGIASALALLRARTTADVEAAWAGWVEPVDAVLTADRDGRVVELTAGRVPVRDAGNREAPVPAWEPGHGWTGWAGHGRAEVADAAVHANHATELTTPHGRDFATPARATRIATLLAEQPVLDVDDHRRIHMDTLHVPGLRLVERTKALTGLSEDASAVREVLLAWDGRMDRDSHDARRYAAFRASLVEQLCATEALSPLASHDLPAVFDAWMSLPSRVLLRLELLLDDPPGGFDVPTALAEALEAAAAVPAGATWGERHRFVAARIGPPGEELPPGVPVSGDRDCVLATSSMPEAGDIAMQAPAARYVWDLSDRSRSRWVVPHGATGSPGSAHASDQQPLWLDGRLAPVPDGPLGDPA